MNGSLHVDQKAPRRVRLRLRRTGLAALVAGLLAGGLAIIDPAAALPGTGTAEESFWAASGSLSPRLSNARRPVELGMRFTTSRAGSVSALRFYKHPRSSDGHTASLWDDRGNRLAKASFTVESSQGWQEARLPKTVALSPGRTYTVSYFSADGRYAVVPGYFTRNSPRTESLRAQSRNGVYVYDSSAFPTRASAGRHNYLVDVTFQPATTSPSPTPTTSPTPTPTRTPTPTPTATPTVTPTPSVTPTVTPTPSVTPTITPTPSPTGRADCDLPRHPNLSCTGVPPGTKLTTVKGNVTAAKQGQVIDGQHITGDLIITANDVVIRNSQIDGLITNWETGGSFTITDSTVGPPSGCVINQAVGEKNFKAERISVRGFDDGFRMSGRNIVVRDSYVKLCGPPTSHSDGIQAYCPGKIVCSGLVFDHNTIDQRQAPEHSDPINLVDKNLSAVTVSDNLVAGGNYSLLLKWHAGPKWKVSGNKIVHEAWDFGAVSSEDTCENIDWGPGNAVVTIDHDYRITKTVRTLTHCVE
ncbi:hypothetical protein GCM10009850_033590 [Nonomuraea monospora]|uniref:DUF4082 domain-containing protein n=1 Tax=Nonomuraea monospora TaxID=568818 RepID=A0ABP5P7Z2_9ACTN